MMIQSNPPRAEARRLARKRASMIVEHDRAMAAEDRGDGPNRTQRRLAPVEPGTGPDPHSNRSNAPKRAARIRAQRRAIRLARRHTR